MNNSTNIEIKKDIIEFIVTDTLERINNSSVITYDEKYITNIKNLYLSEIDRLEEKQNISRYYRDVTTHKLFISEFIGTEEIFYQIPQIKADTNQVWLSCNLLRILTDPVFWKYEESLFFHYYFYISPLINTSLGSKGIEINNNDLWLQLSQQMPKGWSISWLKQPEYAEVIETIKKNEIIITPLSFFSIIYECFYLYLTNIIQTDNHSLRKNNLYQDSQQYGGKLLGKGSFGSVWLLDSVEEVRSFIKAQRKHIKFPIVKSIVQKTPGKDTDIFKQNTNNTEEIKPDNVLKSVVFKKFIKFDEMVEEINSINKVIKAFALYEDRNIFKEKLEKYTTLIIDNSTYNVVKDVKLAINYEDNGKLYSMVENLVPYKKCDGDLEDFQFKNSDQVLKFLESVIEFLYIIKKDNLYHGDIKPPNILYKKQGENVDFYVSDYGSISSNPILFSPIYRHPDTLSFDNLIYQRNLLQECIAKSNICNTNQDIINTVYNIYKVNRFGKRVNHGKVSINMKEAHDQFAIGITLLEVLARSNLSKDSKTEHIMKILKALLNSTNKLNEIRDYIKSIIVTSPNIILNNNNIQDQQNKNVIQQLGQQINEAKSKLTELTEQINSLNKNLENGKNEFDNQVAQIVQLQKQVQLIENDIEERIKKLNILNKNISDKENIRNKQDNEFNLQQQEIANLNKQINDKKNEIVLLEKQIQQKQQIEASTINQMIQDKMNEITILNQQINLKEKEKNIVIENIEEFTQIVHQLKEQISELEDYKERLKNEITSITNKNLLHSTNDNNFLEEVVYKIKTFHQIMLPLNNTTYNNNTEMINDYSKYIDLPSYVTSNEYINPSIDDHCDELIRVYNSVKDVNSIYFDLFYEIVYWLTNIANEYLKENDEPLYKVLMVDIIGWIVLYDKILEIIQSIETFNIKSKKNICNLENHLIEKCIYFFDLYVNETKTLFNSYQIIYSIHINPYYSNYIIFKEKIEKNKDKVKLIVKAISNFETAINNSMDGIDLNKVKTLMLTYYERSDYGTEFDFENLISEFVKYYQLKDSKQYNGGEISVNEQKQKGKNRKRGKTATTYFF